MGTGAQGRLHRTLNQIASGMTVSDGENKRRHGTGTTERVTGLSLNRERCRTALDAAAPLGARPGFGSTGLNGTSGVPYVARTPGEYVRAQICAKFSLRRTTGLPVPGNEGWAAGGADFAGTKLRGHGANSGGVKRQGRSMSEGLESGDALCCTAVLGFNRRPRGLQAPSPAACVARWYERPDSMALET